MFIFNIKNYIIDFLPFIKELVSWLLESGASATFNLHIGLYHDSTSNGLTEES